MSEPQTETAATYDSIEHVFGAAMMKDGLVLHFDPGTGAVRQVNDAASFLLELPDDGLDAYSFDGLLGADAENASNLWMNLHMHNYASWEGALSSALSGTAFRVRGIAVQTETAQGMEIILHATRIEEEAPEAAEAEGGGILSKFADILGVMEYDTDGIVLSSNDRARMALGFYADDPAGTSMEDLRPKAIINDPAYVEFWEKLRKGSIVEDCFAFVTQDGDTVWLQSTFLPQRDASGIVTSVMQCMMDVSDSLGTAKRDAEVVRSLHENMMIAEYGQDGHIVDISAAMCARLGLERDETIGKINATVFHEEFSHGTHFEDLWTAEGYQTADVQHARAGGASAWARGGFIPMRDSEGQVTSVLEISFPMEEELAELQELRVRHDALNDIFSIVDITAAGSISAANKWFCFDTQGDEKNYIGESYTKFVPADMLQTPEWGEFWTKLRAGERLSGQFRRVDADGREIWFQSTYAPLAKKPGEKGRRMICVSRNISEQHKRTWLNEKKTQVIEQSFGLIEYDPQGNIIDATPTALKMLAYSKPDVMGKPYSLFYADDYAESTQYRTFWQRLREGEKIVRAGVHRTTGAGEDIWMDLAYMPILDHAGQVERVIELSKNVTKHHTGFIDLREKWRATMETFAVASFDLDGIAVTVNEGFSRIMGYSSREVLGQHHSSFCTPETAQSVQYRSDWIALAKGEKLAGLYGFEGRLGRRVQMEACYIPVRNALGEVHQVIMLAHDVTEKMMIQDNANNTTKAMSDQIAIYAQTQSTSQQNLSALFETLSSSNETIQLCEAALHTGKEKLQSVKEAVSVISETITTVNDIATQTNLLAFNAAIEAARVGAQGEGFSIVAEEVRRLAERNATAAREIAKQVQIVTDRTQTGASTTEEAIKLAVQSGKLLSEGNVKVSAVLESGKSQIASISDAAAALAKLSHASAAR